MRDPFGIRPLVIGKLKAFYIRRNLCFDIVGAPFIREVQNGEIVVIENNEIKSKAFHIRNQDLVFLNIFISQDQIV